VIVEGYFLSFLLGLAKILGLYKKCVYISGDWLEGSRRRSNPLGYIANDFFFPMIDFLSCKLNYAVFDISDVIAEKRYNYWNKQITQKEENLFFPLFMRSELVDKDSINKNLCFLGIMRDECGLDVAINSLKILREHEDFHIKVIGAYSYEYQNLKKLAQDRGVGDVVHFYGFTARDRFGSILSDCFCGMHLLKSRNSYNSFSLPAKLGDYVQYVQPMIVSTNVGYFKDIILANKLGLVIEPCENEFVTGVLELYTNQVSYRKNILKYLEEFKETRIEEIVGV